MVKVALSETIGGGWAIVGELVEVPWVDQTHEELVCEVIEDGVNDWLSCMVEGTTDGADRVVFGRDVWSIVVPGGDSFWVAGAGSGVPRSWGYGVTCDVVAAESLWSSLASAWWGSTL